jgi:hypothetical protein
MASKPQWVVIAAKAVIIRFPKMASLVIPLSPFSSSFLSLFYPLSLSFFLSLSLSFFLVFYHRRYPLPSLSFSSCHSFFCPERTNRRWRYEIKIKCRWVWCLFSAFTCVLPEWHRRTINKLFSWLLGITVTGFAHTSSFSHMCLTYLSLSIALALLLGPFLSSAECGFTQLPLLHVRPYPWLPHTAHLW